MRKLLVVPITVMTGLLVAAFLMPGRATVVGSAVAPVLSNALHLGGLLGSTSVNQINVPDGSPVHVLFGKGGQTGSVQGGSGNSSTGALQVTGLSGDAQGHSVATTGQQNCGRFGNGFHGGKHLFVCPNRPFPAPANH